MKAAFILRLRIISICLLIFALLLVGRLYFIQIVQGEEFSARADEQYVRPNQNLYSRGSIFFTNKEGQRVSAATLKSGYTVAINPIEIENPERVFKALSAVIPIDAERFFLRANKKDDPYEEVAKRISNTEANSIDELNLDGVSIYKERWRYYPGDTLASHAIGFVAYDQDERTGRYGLERYYNDTLARTDNNLYVNFFAEIFANVHASIVSGSDQWAGDVITSIEPSVQAMLEEKLSDVSEEWGSRFSAGIVIDPKTGDIYALSKSPNFNLNAFEDAESAEAFANPLVERVYEMGSIVKPLTMAAGLDAGVVTPETTYDDYGSITLNGSTIHNYDGEGRGEDVPMQEVLNQSLNTGAVFVEQELGNEQFAEYMRAYGFGEETGIDLPNETAGLTNNLESPRDIEYATASFGQGVAFTPIATVRALSALANGGTLVTPHIAQKIEYETGFSKNVSFPEGDRVISKKASEEITRMLVSVVDEALSNGEVALPNYSIAAKTGTAQIPHPEEGGYYEDRYLHSFFGYFPAYEPRFLVFLMTVEPEGARYASQTLTNPFMDMVGFLINHYEIQPDREQLTTEQ